MTDHTFRPFATPLVAALSKREAETLVENLLIAAESGADGDVDEFKDQIIARLSQSHRDEKQAVLSRLEALAASHAAQSSPASPNADQEPEPE